MFRVFDFLGFPWILLSETRLINGLRAIFREKFFVALFPVVNSAGTGIYQSWPAEARNCSSGKLSLISDFLQDIVGELCRRGMSCWERWVEVAMTGFVGWVGKVFAVLASDSSLSGALGGVFPANGSSSAHQHERPFHVHRHGDELQMASVAPKPQIADTAHAVPALHRGEGALNR